MKNKIAVLLAYGAGLSVLLVTVGQALTSVSAISSHFKMFETQGYWTDRLMAGLYLGSIGLFFATLVTLAGAYLLSSADTGKIWAGKLMLFLTILFHIPATLSVLSFTPSDWSHTLPHIAAMVLAGLAIALKPGILNKT